MGTFIHQPCFEIRVTNLVGINSDQLIDIKIELNAFSAAQHEIMGKNTLDALIKYKNKEDIPASVIEELKSYTSFSTDHFLQATNFCSSCLSLLDKNNSCKTHPHLQKPTVMSYAEAAETVETTPPPSSDRYN